SSGTASIVANNSSTTSTVSCAPHFFPTRRSSDLVTVTDNSVGTFVTPTGTVTLAETGVTGSFTTCTLAGTTASATCTSTLTASTSEAATVTATFAADTAHSGISGTTSIVVNLRTTAT